MASLLLDLTNWDLVLDVNGNIAVAQAPYALAQDAACAIKLFQGELYYDTSQGVPYQNVLGKFPPLSLVKADLVAAALTVTGVVAAQCLVSGINGRQLTGQVQVTDGSGNVSVAGF